MINWSAYPDFSEDELRCKCGCGRADMAPSFMWALQQLRTALGFALSVTSGFRCPDHNDRVSSTGRNGPHTTGKAVDLGVDRGRAFALLMALSGREFTGLGLDQKGGGRFIHLDMLQDGETKGPRPTVWTY